MGKKLEMDRRRWLAASPYLNQALNLPPERLDAWLQELAATQPAIAVDLRRLMAVPTESFASFLGGQAVPLAKDLRSSYQGELIGNYRVLQELGSGGMAVVYLAERADGHFEQRAALKILRFGADSGEARRHFAQERQILASLNHPAIARLIDGGITTAGLPYLAMEYVEGLPIDRFCDQQRLCVGERLRLFLKVADAVQHAHHHLIVHRDLKPSNIVVTRDGAVKLLDFGIAKLLEPDSFVHAAPPTADIIRLMTPEYASPEQARGGPITAATDVYQLGRLLYELLTGQSPYGLRARNSLELLRLILECEPRRPSAAISRADATSGTELVSLETISAARSVTPERLRQTLRGDLDAVLLMALHKEPQRRYASVARFADDVDRYLRSLPVSAYDGVWLYRAGKFLRRHVAGVAIAAAAMCAFVLLIVWYTTQLANERDNAAAEAQRARREAATAEQVSEFLSSVFRGSSSSMARGQTTARELLDRGAERIEAELAGQPVIQARLLNVIGKVYYEYDAKDKAQALVERALQLNMQQFGAASIEVADSKFALAAIIRERGDLAQAQRLFEEVLQVRERNLGPRHVATADVWHALAATLDRQGQSREAVRMCERALDIYAHSVGQYDERAVSAMVSLAATLLSTGQFARARTYYEKLVPVIERTLGPEHRNLAGALVNLTVAKMRLEDYQGVEQTLQQALAILERLYMRDHSDVQIVVNTLGSLYYETGRFQDAIRMFERSIASSRRVSGPGHPFEATAQQMLGQLLRSAGDFDGAQVYMKAAVEIWRQSPGASRFRYAISLADYGELLMDQGQADLAAKPLGEAMTILRQMHPYDDYDFAGVRILHGVLLARTGRAIESEAQIREVISIYRKVLPATHSELAAAYSALGESLLAQGKLAEAEKVLIDSDKLLEQRLQAVRRRSLQRLIHLYERKQDLQSVDQYRKLLVEFERRVRAARLA